MEPLAQLVDKELEQREQLAHLVMVHVLKRCSSGKGHVRRGPLQQLVYKELGFVGRPGRYFQNYVTKVLAENGYRASYSRGYLVYYGLTWKEPLCQDQKESKKPNPENEKSLCQEKPLGDDCGMVDIIEQKD